MKFLDRSSELRRLGRLTRRREGGFAVLHGRRRIGKTRILVEWTRKAGGLYTVADESAPDVQRRYFAQAVAGRLPGFADVEYPDWRRLLDRLAREARDARWRGPLVFDEFPYLAVSSPELPSVLQRWIDHESMAARLVVAIAGSSQRMMQGLVLAADAPLYGRAQEILDIGPLEPRYLPSVLDCGTGGDLVEAYAAWGGVPRYWELAADARGSTATRVDRLVLDPLGPLHREPDGLLQEEIPSAQEVRPVLDVIGSGAHRVSEIAGRLGRPATSMARPLKRLVDMGLARREVPFGLSERKSRRTLYRIGDPFVRMWFRAVAPHRAQLASATASGRRTLLQRFWPNLVAEAWEDLCRLSLPKARGRSLLARSGPWGPAFRWWHGNAAEWDLVSASEDGRRLLLGEVKWKARPFQHAQVDRAWKALVERPPPRLPAEYADREVVRGLFVPELADDVRPRRGALVVTVTDLL